MDKDAEIERLRRDVARLHRALSEGYGVEDGGVWEDRALLAERDLEDFQRRLADGLRAVGIEPGRNPDGVNDDPEKAAHALQDAQKAVAEYEALGEPEWPEPERPERGVVLYECPSRTAGGESCPETRVQPGRCPAHSVVMEPVRYVGGHRIVGNVPVPRGGTPTGG